MEVWSGEVTPVPVQCMDDKWYPSAVLDRVPHETLRFTYIHPARPSSPESQLGRGEGKTRPDGHPDYHRGKFVDDTRVGPRTPKGMH